MIEEKIIEILKSKSGYVSGEEISDHLRLSRQALWKHIQELRDSGYDIVAVPHLGYQLVQLPDRLFPQEIGSGLETKFIGKKIHYQEKVSSTMDLALNLGLQGASEGTVIVTESQSKGRGRLGRNWISPKYKGIYFSVILRPKISPLQASLLTILCAVGLCEAIKENAQIEPQIKWPNDLLINQKKIAGILTELNAEMDEVRFVNIGIGLNVNTEKKALISSATSLKEELGKEVNRVELLKAILRRIETNYLLFRENRRKEIIEKWREYNTTLGKRVKILVRNQHLEGQAVDIDLDGALLVRKDSGVVQKISSGDIILCR
ncbi:MAG: biotin--[acetyl-CoA-carboxylase] ligase [Candidatus Omnitrophica bacterium]|nr:biotin--[acetyl-CoA-carboxylase] ligase [Candidatus Omnitrophota bacterium]MDD5653917.1 biotin--[acetyl-CoA-carboxylase] ligase [Candidatus Omnitrophota bacterium]